MTIKVVARNRKASHDFTLFEKYEAGIVLRGSEIKSIRAGQVSLKESFVRTNGEEAYLVNAHIAPYDPASSGNHEPTRERKLLLHRREIEELWDEVRKGGHTIVPLQLYLKDGRAKLEIAVARGKRAYDKRQDMKARDAKRDIEQALRQRD
jgi:SsrA-binding protein